jgi:hypothetical protein
MDGWRPATPIQFASFQDFALSLTTLRRPNFEYRCRSSASCSTESTSSGVKSGRLAVFVFSSPKKRSPLFRRLQPEI